MAEYSPVLCDSSRVKRDKFTVLCVSRIYDAFGHASICGSDSRRRMLRQSRRPKGATAIVNKGGDRLLINAAKFEAEIPKQPQVIYQ